MRLFANIKNKSGMNNDKENAAANFFSNFTKLKDLSNFWTLESQDLF